MNEAFRRYVETAKTVARSKGLDWDPPYDVQTGKIAKTPVDHRWNISALRNERGAAKYLASYEAFDAVISRAEGGDRPLLSPQWRDLLKAVIVDQAFVKSNKATHAVDNIGKSIRILGTVAGDLCPWELTGDIVREAYNRMMVNSPKGAMNVEMTVRTVLDVQRLCDAAPLARFCTPYQSEEAKVGADKIQAIRKQQDTYHAQFERSKLTDRKNVEKLPEARAFWELVRILFTEKPLTFSDAVKFEQGKIAIFAGMRAVEASALPLRCLEYRDIMRRQRPASVSVPDLVSKYGYEQALYLINFAAKQIADGEGSESVLVRRAQSVPIDQQEIMIKARDRIEYLTSPLRNTLRCQRETGRLLPMYEPENLVDVVEIYPVLTGNLWFLSEPEPIDLINAYRASWSHEDRRRIVVARDELIRRDGSKSYDSVRKFFSALVKDGLPVYRNGSRTDGNLGSLGTYVRIGELEDYLRRNRKTKLSDLSTFDVSNGGSLLPEDNLVLLPKRALVEGRNNGILDIDAYCSVGIYHAADFMLWLSQSGSTSPTIFKTYGETEADKLLELESHSLRHLKTTELLRNGVVDTAIAYHMNRRNPQQNEVYDRRSLLEELEDIDVPDEALDLLEERSLQTLKLIISGRARGPIVEKFKSIRETEGERSAFEYLAAEADGFHVTPWGYCLKSFWIDSCPKHLQCSKGCFHFAKSDDPSHETYARTIRERTQVNLDKLRANPNPSPGYGNQMRHAEEILEGIDAILAAKPGERVFPNGKDLFEDVAAPASVLDTGRLTPETMDLFDD